MRNSIYAVMAISLFVIACEKNNDDDQGGKFTSETVAMGANSMNDVYFSLANGDVNTIDRTDWDIAFSVPLQTATVLINEGAGVELYCVGDTSDWATIDENTISGLEPRFNDESDWYAGAFNVNAAGFPNYGWGTYHAGTPDHNVGGDSLYVIKLSDASFRKFMIRVKVGATSANVIRWADLNGDNETIESIATTPYSNKHFIQYSLVNKEVVEAEPDKATWDLLFTRYVIKVPTGPGTFMNYPVMGVLNNSLVAIAQVTGVPEDVDTSTVTNYTSAPDAIGSDWKVSDPVTHEISLVENMSYFIRTVDDNTYQLYFTAYGGNAAGTISFKVRKIE